MKRLSSACSSVFNGIFLHQKLILAIFLAVVTFWVYAPVRHHEFLQYDDYSYVAGNARIQQGLTWENVKWSMTAFEQALWKPVTLMSHMLDCQLFGLNPAGHLLMNLLIHGVNVILLLGVLSLMTGAFWPSVLVAALFALHPLNVESVAWVAERKNVLSTLFWLLTMWAYLGYSRRPNWKRYLGVMVVLVLGLMSKPMLVTLPCALLLLDYWPLGRLGKNWHDFRQRVPGLLWEKLPFFVPVALVSVLTLYGADTTQGLPGLAELSLGDRMGNALLGYGFYLKKMVWPVNLAVIYPLASFRGSMNVGSVVFVTVFLAGASLGVWWRRWSSRYLVVGWLWYLGTLFPVSGLLQSGNQAMADRYSYVPLIGVFIMLAWGSAELAEKNQQRGKKWLVGAGVCVLVLLAILTRVQLRHWQNTTTLFEHALAVTTDNFIAHNGLGLELREQGEDAKAQEQFQEALRIKPDYADAHNHLGLVLLDQGRLNQAIEHFSRALQSKPRSHEVFNNLGMALAQRGDLDQAIEYFEKAIEIEPGFALGHSNLGTALQQEGRLDEALEHCTRAVEIDPGLAEAHNVLGIVLFQTGKIDEAIEHLSRAVEIEPGLLDAYANLGSILEGQNRREEAAEAFRQVLRLDPGNATAQRRLANLLEKMNRPD